MKHSENVAHILTYNKKESGHKMNIELLLLLCMIFCHIIDDYYMQGKLADYKQKNWWKNNAPQNMYKYDYIMALLMHSFSWSFMILLPLTIYTFIMNKTWHIIIFIINMIIHCIIDDLKANKFKINLIQDQTIHLLQIIISWAIWLYI